MGTSASDFCHLVNVHFVVLVCYILVGLRKNLCWKLIAWEAFIEVASKDYLLSACIFIAVLRKHLLL
jgi:hypothetical protein